MSNEKREHFWFGIWVFLKMTYKLMSEFDAIFCLPDELDHQDQYKRSSSSCGRAAVCCLKSNPDCIPRDIHMIRPLVPLKTPGLCRLQRRCDRYRWRHLVRCRRGYTAVLGYPHTLLQHWSLRTNSLLDILRNVFLGLQWIMDGWTLSLLSIF